MQDSFIEQFYENVILPRYGENININNIRWKDHGKVDLDAWAHYFDDENGREYVLLYEDYPSGSFLDDNLSHELVKIGEETSIGLSFNDEKEIPNITGWFSLYREKSR